MITQISAKGGSASSGKYRLHRFRRKTKVIKVGKVKIGGTNPVSIQSMLKTKTSNIKKAIKQINDLEKAGCEIIRVAVKDARDARAIEEIKKKIKIPLAADIHFDYRLGLEAIRNGADKIRINPGNIYKPVELKAIITAAKKQKIPIRIGVNSGSIPRQLQTTNKCEAKRSLPEGDKLRTTKLVNFALKYIKLFERQNFRDIIISLKSSDVMETVEAYRKLAKLCNYPFHLGITAAGPYDEGIVKSSIGIGSLLLEGIGDTMRVSLTGNPIEEVIAAKRILQSLGLRNFGPDIISCPTCGRCQVDLARIVKELDKQLSAISYPPRGGSASLRTQLSAKYPISIAVMGCEVNGPGEARGADIGIVAGKKFGTLFKKGKIIKRIEEKSFVKEIIKAIKAEGRKPKAEGCM